MHSTQIIDASDLDQYANTRESQGVIPELIYLLVKQSILELSVCRIPYGDSVNQPGMDGLVETEQSFQEFVPKGKSYWEIGTGRDPQTKATKDFRIRTKDIPETERKNASFVFVTPRGSDSGGWGEPKQREWLKNRQTNGWAKIIIIDGGKLADWLREFPAIGMWMAIQTKLSNSLNAFTIPAEHWKTIQSHVHSNDAPLPANIFHSGSENACTALQRLFEGQSQKLLFFAESEKDVVDFIAAYLASLDPDISQTFSNRCLFVNEKSAWLSIIQTRKSHVLVADPRLGLDSEEADLQVQATQKGHSVIIPVCAAWHGKNQDIIRLRSPSYSELEIILREGGYSRTRAKELAQAGANRLSALKRHLIGFGSLPPYATWENARILAQAGLIGKWDGNNQADQDALEDLLGKEYGEWIKIVRPELMRPDTPLLQRNEKWRMVSRGEAWGALGPSLTDNDLDRLQKAALSILSERDPKFDLPKEDRYAASIYGKCLQHSSLIREGIAETLALLGSRPESLSFCTQGKPEAIAQITVRELLENATWGQWVSLGNLLPLLAEAAPNAFLSAVEMSLQTLSESPFHQVFAQESSGTGGWNHISSLLWALETLAWHPDYLTRVILILGDLASIDPGGTWSNRPSNSLADILLPWHPHTTASIERKKSAIEALVVEHSEIGWELLVALIPHSHSTTFGCSRPTWRNLIPEDWEETVTDRAYREQIVIYANMAVTIAASNIDKLCVLIQRLPDIPNPAFDEFLEHLSSETIINLPEQKRAHIWGSLNNVIRKHRKYVGANWVIPEEILQRIEITASKLAPKSPELQFHHLFSEDDSDLYDEKGNYQEQDDKLDQLRRCAVLSVFDVGGINAVLDFSQTVSAPYKVGHVLGEIENNDLESSLLPDLLDIKDEDLKNTIAGFVWTKFQKLGWSWADSSLAKSWDISQKVEFFLLLPFNEDVWARVEIQLGKYEKRYWSKVYVRPFGSNRDFTRAIEKLIRYGRANAAVGCLWRSIDEEKDFDTELAVRTLLSVIESEHPEKELNAKAIVDVISKLQNTEQVDINALYKIEWNFLPLLDKFSSGSPQSLENRLATDPSFFCEVISLAFRSKNEENTNKTSSDYQMNLAKAAYQLLSNWKTPPGLQPDGTLDAQLFSAWVGETKKIAKETGYIDIVQIQLGSVLTYTPKDESGLWIHKTVAQALNEKDAQKMRSCFSSELFNRRGVYHCSGGKE